MSYGKFMALRSVIRRAILHAFKVGDERETHNGVSELLEVLGIIVVTALVMVIRMKANGPGTSIMALDIADCLYSPAIGEHVPGVTNKLAEY